VKDKFLTGAVAFGGAIVGHLGGWEGHMMTLVMLMAFDYATGLVLAGVFKKSKKSGGSLASGEMVKGIFRKGMVLGVIFIAHRLDLALGSSYIADVVTIGFIAAELLSIVENLGLMGVPIHPIITKAIEILQTKAKGEVKDVEKESQ
jgi:toxin secretion/phage lysis holin